MKYTVNLTKKAQKTFRKLNVKMKKRILNSIGDMLEYYNGNTDVPAPDVKILHGKFAKLLRLRVGDYRVIFSMHNNKLIILVIDILPRDEAYK